MLLPPIRRTCRLIRRYQRFLADVQCEDGGILTVHCPNSGAMLGCSTPGSPAVISRSANPGRKYAWTLEMVFEQGVWIGVNTARSNHLVREGLESGVVDAFGTVRSITAEVKVSAASRLDFLLETEQGRVYLEVKNCSLVEDGVALFPDAVTARGSRHLEELAQLADQGHGAAVLYCIQRADAGRFAPAARIDPHYARTAVRAAARGVRLIAFRATVSPESVTLAAPVPVSLPY